MQTWVLTQTRRWSYRCPLLTAVLPDGGRRLRHFSLSATLGSVRWVDRKESTGIFLSLLPLSLSSVERVLLAGRVLQGSGQGRGSDRELAAGLAGENRDGVSCCVCLSGAESSSSSRTLSLLLSPSGAESSHRFSGSVMSEN